MKNSENISTNPTIIKAGEQDPVELGGIGVHWKIYIMKKKMDALLLRKPHWMVLRYFGNTRVNDLLFNRFSEQILPTYHNASKTQKYVPNEKSFTCL